MEEHAQLMTQVSRRSLWKNRTFSFMISGYSLSIFGDCFQSIALNIWILQETGSAKLMSATLITSMVMSLLFGSVAGTLADRIDRRKLMWVTDIINSILVLGIALCISIQDIPFILIIILTAVKSFVGLFKFPAFQSSLTDIVGKERVQQATGAMGIADNTARITGLALGGAVVAGYGGVIAIIINAFMFMSSAIFILLGGPFPYSIKKTETVKRTFQQDFIEGFKYIWKKPFTRSVIILSPILGMFFTSFLMLTQVAAVKVWKASPLEFGLIEASIPAGYLCGAGVIMLLGHSIKQRGRWIVGSMILIAPIFIFISFLSSAFYSIPFIFLIGILFAFSTFLVNVIMRVEVESDIQGRLFGILGSLSSIAPPLALLIFSFFADIYGPLLVLMINGIGLLIAGALSFVFLKPISLYK